MSKYEQDLQRATVEFKKLQTDMSNTVEARQKLDYQQSESELVLKELNILKPHNVVYKLVGPGLVAQDTSEAKQTVEKRLEFISKEIQRIEKQIKEVGGKAEQKRSEIVKIQGDYQQLMASQQQHQSQAQAA